MDHVDLSIIVINFNTFELTCTCLEHLFQSETNYSYEVILVDNASTDRPATDFLLRFPKLVLIVNDKNIGFGQANNVGMERAAGDYLWLLNSDTEVAPTVLERAMTTLLAEQADLYSCAQVLGDGTPIFYKKASFSLGHSLRTIWYSLPFYDWAYFSRRRTDLEPVEQLIEAETVSGAFMLMRRQVYETTRGFDPDFFLYSEETEWCYNRIRKDYKIIYDPHNVFVHKQGSSSAKQDMRLQEFISKSLGYYKEGYGKYVLYLLLQYGVALPMNLFFYAIAKPHYKQAYRDAAQILWRGGRYLLGDIPRYANRYGARDKFLVIKEINV